MTSGNRAILKHLINDNIPTDQVFYFDTNFAVSAIFQDQKKSFRHQAIIKFIKRLLEAKVSIACSSVLYHEFIRVTIRNELKRAQHSRRAIKQALDAGKPGIILPHIKDIENNMQALGELLSKFGTRRRVIFPTEPGMVKLILELRCKYKLDEADAIHLGTMLFGKNKNFISFDRNDFNRIPGINLWCKH